MNTNAELLALVRLSLRDPVAGGRGVLALNPPGAVRWMLLAVTVLVSSVLIYLLPAAVGGLSALPSPFAFAASQAGMNLLVIALIARVGRGFGGTGGFLDALWLVGWMQMITLGLLVVQMAAILLVPALNMGVAAASIAVSIWILVGYICALHGFRSRAMVLVGAVMVFVITSFVLSIILLLLGFDGAELANV